MASSWLFALLLLMAGASAVAAPPQLYRQPAYESPVSGDPDDLLLLAGYGLAADDVVVYRAISVGTDLGAPDIVPTESTAELGTASVVSTASAPYSLTIKLPLAMRAGRAYALWVRNANGEWSKSIAINDARPQWISPAYVYESSMPGFLPRELKIVGRNLNPGGGHVTRVQFIGPQRFVVTAATDDTGSAALGRYVARVKLPARLTPGRYRVMLNRDGMDWVELRGQLLDVRVEPPAPIEFSVADARFGGCRPNDGLDDTACILRAIAAAAHSGGGTVGFGAGIWDLIDSTQPGVSGHEGILVPATVQLRGAGRSVTRVERHAEWNAHSPTSAFTLSGRNGVTGFTFGDLQVYRPTDRAGAFIQLGEDWQNAPTNQGDADRVVSDVTISQNAFDKPNIAIGSGGLPIERLLLTYNIFGAYHAALELTGDKYNVAHKFRIDDSVIGHNVFKPGSELDLAGKTGSIASELGAAYRLDFSANTADGASREYLYTPDDARGWRAAFFWSPVNNGERVLVSQNSMTCTGDKISDGEAISFDNNTNAYGFSGAVTVVDASPDAIAVSQSLAARQNHRDIPIESYYIGDWVQVVGGPGVGQVRKITGYSTDAVTHRTTIQVAPAWDVVPASGQTRITVGRQYWQLLIVDNQVDNRRPLCQKSNRSRAAAGVIALWTQTADSLVAGNTQYDSDGIFVQENYAAAEHPCADCTMMGFFNLFLEIRDNLIDGEYDWSSDCSRSGIGLGVASAEWGDAPPPTVGFGVSVAHNTIRHADAQFGGAIAQVGTWAGGPAPHRWPLSDNVLIQHNSISDIDGPRARPVCGTSRGRIGIAFPDPSIAWHTVLYANSCSNVTLPIGRGGAEVKRICPSSAPDSCECP
jgi:hypothetical protein